MRKIFIPMFFMACIAYKSQAQVDVQLNPVGILFSSVDLSAEFGVLPDFGIEPSIGYDFQNWKLNDIKYRNNAFSGLPVRRAEKQIVSTSGLGMGF